MATYECSICGMSVNATCGKCNEPLVDDILKNDDGSEVQVSKCPNDHGKIIMITDKKGSKKSKKYCDQVLIMPETNIITAPIIYSLPIQLIAYYLAVLLGTDVDQPRNLAKSVTVE